jgi:hypothetical protein
VLLEEQVEGCLQHRLFARAGMAVRQRVAGSVELGQEPLRDREVDPAQVGGERLDFVPRKHLRRRRE